ncbi:MAG: glycosyltransferase family 9 protein [Verrucomicrobia bacterium]|nr:glycosyltransferase family 9 protein [Verrucomicrobiota bacterium]
MRILFTKLLHIGDNLLLTPTLVATKEKFPNSEIWVAVRRGTEGILAGCPEIDRIVTTARPEEGRRTWSDFGRDLLTLAEIACTRFDYAFELGDNNRGRILATASRAKICCTNSYERPEGIPLSMAWEKRFNRLITTGHGPVHQVRRDYNAVRETLGLPEEPPPMRFAWEAMRPSQMEGALEGAISGSYGVVHAATRWSSKSWPLDRWKQVIAALLKRFPQVVISCGPSPHEIAEAVILCEGFEGRVLSTEGKLSWAQLATLLGSASLFVGVDTAAMHLASAVQCPSVVLFGHPPAYQFQPWKCPHRVVRSKDSMLETQRYKLPGEQLMEEISVAMVTEAVESILSERA